MDYETTGDPHAPPPPEVRDYGRRCAARRQVWTVACAGCEKRFQGTLRARYCGVTCRVRAWRARQRDGG